MEYKIKKYIAGHPETIKELFPNYTGRDERSMPDGLLLVEVNLSAAEVAMMESNSTLLLMDHDAAIKYVTSFEKDSTPASAPAPEESSDEEHES